MHEAIKFLFPDILESQYSLQDDGNGPYIKSWDYDQPQPTIEQLATATQSVTSYAILTAAHARINSAYISAVNTVTAGYPENEIASWPKQETEARAWQVNNETPTPWIDSAATAREIPKADFIALVIANADALAPIHGALTGKRQLLRDQIDALNTPTQEQLNAIQW